jgi:RNA polymerase sigma-70 factor (ECF subfamily)
MNKYSYDDIYLACKDRVWKLISRYAFCNEDRKDIFQDIFLAIHKALPNFRGESDINTWVYKIAVNTALKHIDRKKRLNWLLNLLGGFGLVESPPEEVSVDISELKPLAMLNPRQRMILLMAEVEELKLDEIAKMLDIPVGTVKSNLHRAKEIVKKEVENNGGL